MKEKTRQYLLFIYSTLSEDSPVLRDIPLQLAPISSSPYIKFNYGNSGLIFVDLLSLDFQLYGKLIELTIST